MSSDAQQEAQDENVAQMEVEAQTHDEKGEEGGTAEESTAEGTPKAGEGGDVAMGEGEAATSPQKTRYLSLREVYAIALEHAAEPEEQRAAPMQHDETAEEETNTAAATAVEEARIKVEDKVRAIEMKLRERRAAREQQEQEQAKAQPSFQKAEKTRKTDQMAAAVANAAASVGAGAHAKGAEGGTAEERPKGRTVQRRAVEEFPKKIEATKVLRIVNSQILSNPTSLLIFIEGKIGAQGGFSGLHVKDDRGFAVFETEDAAREARRTLEGAVWPANKIDSRLQTGFVEEVPAGARYIGGPAHGGRRKEGRERERERPDSRGRDRDEGRGRESDNEEPPLETLFEKTKSKPEIYFRLARPEDARRQYEEARQRLSQFEKRGKRRSQSPPPPHKRQRW